MSTTQQYFDYSQLSMAAYSTVLGNPNISFLNGLQHTSAGFTQSQASQLIASGWEVVDQSSDTLYGDSGFSATLFHNTQTGEFVFASRGTEPALNDLAFADGWGIALLGTAGSQTIDMYRYYKQLITPHGQAVSYTADEIERLRAIGAVYAPLKFATTAQVEYYLTGDFGLGKLSPNQQITTTGHSLGGFLSTWLNALIPSTVDHVYTYNGAGLGGTFPSLFTLVNGTITGTPITRVNDADVSNLFGYGGPAIISGVGGSVGQNIPINIEYKNPIDSALNGLYNHSIVQLTDSIAVANLLSKLDSNITTATYNQIFDKGSNKIGESLEGVLDGLRKYFGKTDATPNDNRDQFYQNLTDLQNSATFQALTGKVTITTPPTSVAEARSDLGLFLSLYYLTPFALKTDGSLTADQQLTAANPDLATQFKDDKLLTPEQIANGEAYFSDMWLNDRAAMLSWVIKENKNDIENPQGLTTVFVDNFSGKNVGNGPGAIMNNKSVIFGDSDAETIYGGLKNDHIYGGGGNDEIFGNEGNDWIEGDLGNDVLHGESGSDSLYGGDGIDTLTGGSGTDFLYGGSGNDVYVHNAGDGSDVITDSDGNGKIQISDGVYLDGGKMVKDATNYWESADRQTHYTIFTGADGKQTLNILLQNGEKIFVNNWQSGKLGINLQDADPSTPVTPSQASNLADYILVSDSSAIDGAGGNDVLVADMGNETVYGGAGNDFLFGNEGDDVLNGGNGNDFIDGGIGQNTIYGGAGDDLILAGPQYWNHTASSWRVGVDVLLNNDMYSVDHTLTGEHYGFYSYQFVYLIDVDSGHGIELNDENWRKVADGWSWVSVLDATNSPTLTYIAGGGCQLVRSSRALGYDEHS